MIIIRFLLICSVLVIIGCSPKTSLSDTDELICLGFDERQCKADEFSIAGNDLVALTTSLQDYLDRQDIAVVDIKIQENYHEFVCQACTTCPELHRIFVKIDTASKSRIEMLGLLNFEVEDCSIF